MKGWLKLSIPKGKRRKRAHKKWMKKRGIDLYLKDVTNQIESEFIQSGLHEKIVEDLIKDSFSGLGFDDFMKASTPGIKGMSLISGLRTLPDKQK